MKGDSFTTFGRKIALMWSSVDLISGRKKEKPETSQGLEVKKAGKTVFGWTVWPERDRVLGEAAKRKKKTCSGCTRNEQSHWERISTIGLTHTRNIFTTTMVDKALWHWLLEGWQFFYRLIGWLDAAKEKSQVSGRAKPCPRPITVKQRWELKQEGG